MRFRETATVQAQLAGLPAPEFKGENKTWNFTNTKGETVPVAARALRAMDESTFVTEVLALPSDTALLEEGRTTPPRLPRNHEIRVQKRAIAKAARKVATPVQEAAADEAAANVAPAATSAGKVLSMTRDAIRKREKRAAAKAAKEAQA